MRPASQLDDELEAVKSKDKDKGAATDIHGCNTTIYKTAWTFGSVVQTHDFQHPFSWYWPSGFCWAWVFNSYHRVHYSRVLSFLTAVHPFVELLDRFDILYNEKWRMLLSDDCHAEVVDRHHHFSLLRALYQSTDMVPPSMSSQIHISYFNREEGSLLSVHEIIIPRSHSHSLSIMIRSGIQFIYLYSAMHYAMTLELDY